MSLTGSASNLITISNYETDLSFDGDTFDANQIGYATVVYANGHYSLYYAGLSYSNQKELGLATSIDGDIFTRVSNEPIVAPSEEPSFASFRFLPDTVLFENGIYKMWFSGINSNSMGDSNQTTGWGYGTSTDGVNWSFQEAPIRAESGSFQGNLLIEVSKLNGQYLAFYIDANGNDYSHNNKYFVAYSSDGVNFSGDTEFDDAGGAELFTATSAGDKIISIWNDGTDYYTAYTTDGINFVRVSQLDLPDNVGPTDMTLSDGMVTVWCGKYEGPGTWGGGTSSVGSFTLSLSAFLGTAIPLDNPINFTGASGNDTIMGGNNKDTISGGNGQDVVYGADGNDSIAGDNGNDFIFGGRGNDWLGGGNGADRIYGGIGSDTLTGGNGPDAFIFAANESGIGRDTISDLSSADSIILSGFGSVSATDVQMIQQGVNVLVSIQALDAYGLPVQGELQEILILSNTVASISLNTFSFI